MSRHYSKLASTIVYSSLWEEDGDTCKIWVTLLALKDQNGLVENVNVTGISRLTKIPVEKVEEAINKFMSPDPKSSSDAHDGRRLEKVERGWFVLNHFVYQESGWSDEKKERERIRKAQYREKLKASENGHTDPPQSDPPKKPEKKYHDDAKHVLAHLNLKADRQFRETDINLTTISARLSEKDVDPAEVLVMIDRMCAKWKADPKMCEYLQPSTLFGKEKFGGYYDNRYLPVASDEGTAPRKNVDHKQIQEGLKAPRISFGDKPPTATPPQP